MAGADNGHVLDCIDVFGDRVVFEGKNFERHKKRHPELRESAFFPKRVQKTLEKPTFTILGNAPHVRCYYYEEYANNDIMMYTKVVVHEQHRKRKVKPICIVKTAFRIDHIQELKYGFKPQYHQ